MSVTFVGRADELAVIGRAVEAAIAGATTVVLVSGEPGQGKSRLLDEAAARFGPGSGTEPLWVRGYELERAVPFAAASELLRAVRSDDGSTLDRLLAGPGEHRPATVEPLQVFEAVHLGLRNRGATLLLVDDVQWLDDRSLALAHYLIRAGRAGSDGRALVVAGRPSRPLTELADATRGLAEEAMVRIDLAPLAEADGTALVRMLAPGTEPEHAAEIHRLAAGFPFWIRTLVNDEASGAGGLIRIRLQGVSADAAELLALLTVLGRSAAPAELAPILRWADTRLAAAASELVARAIATEGTGSLQLAHDLVRAAAEREVPSETLRALHDRVADALEAAAGEDVQRLRSALVHRRAAGRPAIDLGLRLARSGRRRWLNQDDIIELAAIAAREEPAGTGATELWQAIAALATELGEHRLALDRWTALAESAADPRDRAEAHVEAARAAFALDLTDEAHRSLAAAAESGPDPTISIRMEALTAELEIWADRHSSLARGRAERAALAARELALAAGGVEGLADRARRAYLEALQPAFESALQADDHASIEGLADELLRASAGFDDAAHLKAMVWGAVAARQLDHLDDAASRAGRALREAQQRVLPRAAVDAGRVLASTLFDLGRLPEAEAVARDADQLAARVGDSDRVGRRMKSIGHEIGLLTGDWRQIVPEALHAAAAEPVAHFALAYHQMLGTWQARIGGVTAAVDVAARVADARRLALEARCPRCAAEVELASAEALVRTGELNGARATLDGWDASGRTPSPRMAFWRSWVDALAADPAVDRIDELLTATRQTGRRLDELWLLLDRARLAGRDKGLAAESFREAAQLADTLGVRTAVRLAELGLRGLGVRTWSRGGSTVGNAGLSSLSARELEVARLVAGGASNPEVAASLFLSRKTVERHVSNVLMKVGARNRTELAALVAEALPPATEGSTKAGR